VDNVGVPRLDLIGLIVRSIPESLAFYRLLDVATGEPDGGPHHEATLPNGLRLAWDTIDLMREIDGEWEEPRGYRSGLAFLCDGPTDVDRVYAEVVAAGYRSKKEPWDAFWGQRYAQVFDPDGNSIDLFAPLT
jgi:catechol 2,3-dioxygenase-like lactoylglutathione lyase family enzyme